MNKTIQAPRTTCTTCKKRRDTSRIRRTGGGTYRRGERSNPSSICDDCATTTLAYASFHTGASANGYDVFALARIVSKIDSNEARAAVARYEAGIAEREAADEARLARIAAAAQN